jgi:hypothetical protein
MHALRSFLLLAPPAALAASLAVAAPACGSGGSGSPAGPGDGGGGADGTSGPSSDGGAGEGSTPQPDGGSGPVDSGVSCPAPAADAGLWPYAMPASGRATGPALGCTVCNAGAYVFVQSYATYPTMTYLDIQDGVLTFTEPTTASDARVSGIVQIAAAAPGTYTSSDATNCGSLSVSYVLPVPPGVDCGDGSITGPSCPPGCGSACSGFGCTPCAPNAPEGFYEAQGGATCFEVAEPAIGSWSITLTSVEPYTGDAGLSQGRVLYLAQMVGGDGDAGSEPATVTLGF